MADSTKGQADGIRSLQHTVLECIALGGSLSEALNTVCRQVERMVSDSVCAIVTTDHERQCLAFRAGPSLSLDLQNLLDTMVPGSHAGSCGTAVYRREPVYVSNTETDPLWENMRNVARQFHIAACWSYPIYSETKQVIGSLSVSFPRSRMPTSAEIEVLETASYLTGIAIRRHETEQALWESKQHYRVLYENNPSMYFTVSVDGMILSVNRFGANRLGYSAEELIGQPAAQLLLETDQGHVKERLAACILDPDHHVEWECRMLRKNGETFWARKTARAVKDHRNRLVILVASHDITQRKQAEQRSLSNEQAIRELYDITSARDQSFEYRVRALLALGRRRFNLPIGLLTRRVADELELQFVCSSDPAFEEGKRVPLDVTLCSAAILADKVVSFEHASASEWRHHPGYQELGLETYLGTKVIVGAEAYGTFCFTGPSPRLEQFTEADRDFLRLIARWVGSELERLESEQLQRRLLTIIEGTTDLIGMADSHGQTLYLNRSGKALIGIQSEESPAGQPMSHFHAPEAQKLLIDTAIPQVNETGIWTGDTIMLHRDGRNIPASQVLLAHKDETGHIECYTTIIRDMSAQKAAEEELRQAYENARALSDRLQESEGRLRQIIDLVPHFIFAKDFNGTFILANQAVAEAYGTTLENLIGKTDADFNPVTEEVDHFLEDDRDVIEGQQTKFVPEEQITDAQGNVRYLQTVKIPFRFGDKAIPSILGVSTDITRRKQAEIEQHNLERKVQDAQKLESLGVLAGGIAHDFNNLLTSIIGHADLAIHAIAPDVRAKQYMERVADGARRAAELTQQLLAYTGKASFTIQPINLSTVVEEMGRLLDVSISKKCVLRYQLESELPACEADPSQVRQIIMNLIINASEAIGERSGYITIGTGTMSCDQAYLAQTYHDEHVQEGPYVYMEVADTGIGMTQETRAKIFDPFFTTKFTGRGLGLAAVLGVVRGHRGLLSVYSEVDRGTTFKVLFPVSEAAIVQQTECHQDSHAWRGHGTVLIVDDEETVRVAAQEMFKKMGFHVILAADGREGVEVFKTRVADLRLVVLDMTMPQLNGVETYREMRKINPEIPTILSSGYSEQVAVNEFSGKGPTTFLQKPYRYQRLVEVVRPILEPVDSPGSAPPQ